MEVRLIAQTDLTEELIAAAGRLCYSNPKDLDAVDPACLDADIEADEELLGKLRSMGHLSTFEHVQYTFAVFGISRACSHQLVRHRIASYSQQSQRYVKLDEVSAVEPPSVREKAAQSYFEIAMANAWESYNRLVEKGVPAEDARYVLPNACTTNIFISMNARELLHFFEKRCCNRAQWEIREMALEMRKLLSKNSPTIFKDSGPTCCSRPCPEGKLSCGKPWKKWPDFDRMSRQLELALEEERTG